MKRIGRIYLTFSEFRASHQEQVQTWTRFNVQGTFYRVVSDNGLSITAGRLEQAQVPPSET